MTARRAAAIVAVLTVLGAIARVPGLGSGLWFDEILTLVDSVRLPFSELLTEYPGYNNHPLYSMLARVCIRAFGEHEWTVRLPALVLGIAAIPLLYRLGAVVTTPAEAVMATTLLAVSYHHVWFSQNARGYTALMFFTLLATIFILELFKQPRPRTAVAYGASVGLGIYTHLTMALVVMAHVAVWAWHLWSRPGASRAFRVRMALLALGTGGALSLLLYLPMAASVFAVVAGPPPPTASVATPKWAVIEALRGLRVGFGIVGLLAAGAFATAGALSYVRQRPIVALLFLLPAAVSALVMVVMGMTVRPRFFFSFLGFGLLMLVRGAVESVRRVSASIGVADERRPRVAAAVVGAIAVISAVSLRDNYRYPKQDFEGAMLFIESRRGALEPVATGGLARLPYARYFQKPWTAVDTADDLESLRHGGRRVWVVYSFEEYMDAGLVEDLRRRCAPQMTFPGTLGGGAVIVCTIAPAAG